MIETKITDLIVTLEDAQETLDSILKEIAIMDSQGMKTNLYLVISRLKYIVRNFEDVELLKNQSWYKIGPNGGNKC